MPAPFSTPPSDGAPRAERDAARGIVGGRFEIQRPLATGGEAEVLLAKDLELDLDVVLKIQEIRSPEHLGRLRREAAMLMRIAAHPGLPMVRSDLVEGDRYHMISDHIDGRDLHDLLRAQTAGSLPLATVLDVLDQIGAALDHLHAQRPVIVHGDVKPENVVITSDGRAVLIDFGAATRVGDDRERLGTPGFSAPEVLSGDPVSAASDVYSMASVAVYLLTGLVPKLGTAWPSAMGEVNLARLERVLRRALTWDPLGRPWSASDFTSQLRNAAETEIPTGTVTLLLLTPRDGSTAADAPLLIALESAGGRHVSSVTVPAGRSLFVFPRASDAATIALQLVEPDRPRIALHAGDVGGWHGATLQQLVNETVQLGLDADGVDIVCSPPVRMLLGGDPTLAFRQLPVDAVELRRRAPAGESSAREVVRPRLDPGHAPQWIADRRSTRLVGRDHELADARVELDRSRAGAHAALLVATGEAGMGKSRFLAELAGRAMDSGEVVLVGRCTESGGAFEVLLDALGDDLFPFESGQLERDEEGWVDRRRFFGRIATAIAEEGRAITLLLDDVQWIDGSSLALLAQLLEDVGPSLAVLTGCRPGASSEVHELLIDRPGAIHAPMSPLSPIAFTELAAQLGVELGDLAINDLYALTRGSPFFGLQLLQQLRRSPDLQLGDAGLPIGAHDWILGRVGRLGGDPASMLSTAAIVGRSFDVIVLADVMGTSPLELVGWLETAQDAGLLLDGDRPGEFVFVHAIVQSTLADSLSGTRRALLHAAIGRRLEEDGADGEQLEAALHHWLAADRLGDPLHAGELAAAVGARATERLAHESAVSIVDRALAVIDAAPATTARDGVEARLRVVRGRADFVATRNDEALTQLYRAADLAEQADDAETLVQAALVASLNRRHGLDDAELLRLLERASERCPSEPAVLRAMLHIRRARLLPVAVPHEQRSEMARLGLADLDRMELVDRAMVEIEVARACWVPEDAELRLTTTTRIVELATRQVAAGGTSRWTGVLIEALNLRWAALVQLGDLRGALADTEQAVAIADEAGTTFLLSRVMMGEAMVRVALGEHEQAEQLCERALVVSSRHNLLLVQMAITYCIGRDRGQQADLARLERQLGDLVESNPLFVAAFALVHAEAGQLDDARRLLNDLAAREPWPRNWLWLATTISALESALVIGDDALVERYSVELAPFTGHWAIAAGEIGCWGPIDRVLGLAAASVGRVDDARSYLISARDSSLANGASVWAARCHAGLAGLGDTLT